MVSNTDSSEVSVLRNTAACGWVVL